MSLERFLEQSRQRVDAALAKQLPDADEPPAPLHRAMRYAVFPGGKRLRPALAYAAALACDAEPERVSPVACAVELIHAYSLVHDDLPALDDDGERRGRPSVHVRFGEAGAILTGDALLTEAFGVLAQPGVPLEVMARLAAAAGSRQLVGGQVDDLRIGSGAAATEDAILAIHERKTAALFCFATWGAARVASAPASETGAVERFGRHYGLAFQAVDDLLDAGAGDCSILQVYSEGQARAHVAEQMGHAVEAVSGLGERAAVLRGLAETVAGRLP